MWRSRLFLLGLKVILLGGEVEGLGPLSDGIPSQDLVRTVYVCGVYCGQVAALLQFMRRAVPCCQGSYEDSAKLERQADCF